VGGFPIKGGGEGGRAAKRYPKFEEKAEKTDCDDRGKLSQSEYCGWSGGDLSTIGKGGMKSQECKFSGVKKGKGGWLSLVY